MDGRNTRGMRTCVHISNHNQTPAEEKNGYGAPGRYPVIYIYTTSAGPSSPFLLLIFHFLFHPSKKRKQDKRDLEEWKKSVAGKRGTR